MKFNYFIEINIETTPGSGVWSKLKIASGEIAAENKEEAAAFVIMEHMNSVDLGESN